MNTTHTPAPWSIEERTLYRGDEMIVDENGHFIAAIISMTGMGKTFLKEETDANAKLIAAAPQLLEALMNIVAQFDMIGSNQDEHAHLDDAIDIIARLAIEKATK